MANLSSTNLEFQGAKPPFTEAECRSVLIREQLQLLCTTEKILLLAQQHQLKAWLALLRCFPTSASCSVSSVGGISRAGVPHLKEAGIQLVLPAARRLLHIQMQMLNTRSLRVM